MKLHKDLGLLTTYSEYRKFNSYQYNRYVIDIEIPEENPILQAIFLSELICNGSIFNVTMEYDRLWWEATFYTNTRIRLITSYESPREFLYGLNSIISYFPNYKVTVYHTVDKEKLEGQYYRLPEAKYIAIPDENHNDYVRFIFNFNDNHP